MQNIEVSDPYITKVHATCYKATFDMKLSGNQKMDIEITAKTMERLNEKIEHLKNTGEILRG